MSRDDDHRRPCGDDTPAMLGSDKETYQWNRKMYDSQVAGVIRAPSILKRMWPACPK